MNQKELNQWRTVIVAIAFGTVQGAAFWWGSLHQSEMVTKMFSDLCWADVIALGLVAGKALGQHAAKAGGVKALLGALAGGSVPASAPEPARSP